MHVVFKSSDFIVTVVSVEHTLSDPPVWPSFCLVEDLIDFLNREP